MGPTGAGKTACALALTSKLPLSIVSVDSALVYRGLDIGTAKPSVEQRLQTPHALIDIRDPDQSYSAADFRTDAQIAMEAIYASGRVPLLVGGTGLYFRALEHGMSPLPAADVAVRAAIEARARTLGWQCLHAELQRIDPVAAGRIHPNDPQRIQRAMEVHQVTGRPISSFWEQGRESACPYRLIKIIWAPSTRRALDQPLAQRFAVMLADGLVDECVRLRARYRLERGMPAMRSVGYRQVWDYLEGSLTWEEMVQAAVHATRQLAKRQFTWFRAEQQVLWIDAEAEGAYSRLQATLEAALMPLCRY